MSKKRNYGVAIGPTEPNDSSIFNRVLESFKNIDPEECNVKTYDEYNFISVQVPTYEASKDLATYNTDSNIKVSMVDIEKFDENAHKFWNLFPTLISNKCVNFSKAPTKYGINFRYPPNISTLIFFALMYSLKNNIEIDSINFSYCGIEKEDGFTNFLNFFPNLKEIIFTGNPVTFAEPEFVFGSTQIITDNPFGNVYQSSFQKEQKEGTQQENDDILEQPQLIFQDLSTPSIVLTLDMFPPISFNVDEFPTNGFVCHFFKLMFEKIEDCIYYYSEDAVFSIILQDSPLTECFNDYKSDCQNDSPKHYYGNDNIINILKQLFPTGLKANITSMNCSIIGDDLFSVIVHGVFESEEQIIFGFDRSFFIDFYNSCFRILNDNIFIREPPNIDE